MNVRYSNEPIDTASCDLLVVGVGPTAFGDGAASGPIAQLDAKFGGRLLPELRHRRFKGGEGAALVIPTMDRIAARELLVVGIGDGIWSALRVAAGKAGREARSLHAQSVMVSLPGLDTATANRVVEAMVAGNYQWQAYKPEEERSPAASDWTVLGVDAPANAAQAQVRAKWQGWARDLVNAPAADIYPESLAAKARELAALPGVTVEVWDAARCKAEGLVGITAVGQGSSRPPVMIHVTYRAKDAKDHVALVGKGVTFDSGGLSIKPSDAMITMRCDMGGSATMLATTGLVAELGLAVDLDCFVGAAENMVSGDSYKLGDILRYNNGVTVEIHNTDAEGRLVLADCLIEASKIPTVSTILDSATLTGACVVALGDDFTGLFTDDDALANELLDAARTDGEGLWRLPLHAPYKELLKSDHAQIKNVGSRAAGATTAALFLQHFVKDKRWAHLDIAGPAFMDKANSRYAAGGTGEMVRSLATFLARRAG
ncbi:MAG: leucyl aminopeptidase [Myxococcales bacterium]|nr:leucyl aminopeptidase [Myxococcales bacterium]